MLLLAKIFGAAPSTTTKKRKGQICAFAFTSIKNKEKLGESLVEVLHLKWDDGAVGVITRQFWTKPRSKAAGTAIPTHHTSVCSDRLVCSGHSEGSLMDGQGQKATSPSISWNAVRSPTGVPVASRISLKLWVLQSSGNKTHTT